MNFTASETLGPVLVGQYPTPVVRLACGAVGHALFVKNDGVSHPVYGGNKVRKLERLLGQAEREGARRVLTLGPAGSHHVLATSYFGGKRGLSVRAVLFPQPHSEHAEATLSAALACGLDAVPASSRFGVPWKLLRAFERDTFFIPPGGSNPLGAESYADALGELEGQLDGGPPDVIVVALGSGGTAAGILAGVVQRGLPTLVVAVDVGAVGLFARALVIGLAERVLRRRGVRVTPRALHERLWIDRSQVGPGYGSPTPAGGAATRVAAKFGMQLDPTYTAKAFASALGWVAESGFSRPKAQARRGVRALAEPFRVLYWHTLSAAPLGLVLAGARFPAALPAELRKLFVRGEASI
jgi:D-cysteine desulfhydrase